MRPLVSANEATAEELANEGLGKGVDTDLLIPALHSAASSMAPPPTKSMAQKVVESAQKYSGPSKFNIQANTYNSTSLFEQTIAKYCEVIVIYRETLFSKHIKLPDIDDQRDEKHFGDIGNLASVAAGILTKALYGARRVTWDRLKPICMLACEVTK